MIVYNLFPLLAGTFPNWRPHLERAAAMGFDWVFVNPIQRPGGSGSLYSIADYRAFNPRLVDHDHASGRSPGDQVRQVVKEAERLGLRMMIDLVISHCSVDSPLIASHPEWFIWESAGRVRHPWCLDNKRKVVWKDLAQFDHHHARDKEGLFRWCFEVVRFLVELGFKAFRCDAAYQVPRALWRRLIGEIKRKNPGVLFVAETLGCQPDQTRSTASAGFDFIFNSAKWWDFEAEWFMRQYALSREIAPSIAFPESHDTTRLMEESGGNIDVLKQRYLFAALCSAGVMMPIGYEFGFRRKLHVVKTTPGDWETTGIDLTGFIAKVNRIKAAHPVFQEDAPTEVIRHGNPRVLVVWKGSTRTREEALVILNTDVRNAQHWEADSLQRFVQAGKPLTDVSPEYPLDYLPSPFSYDLRPGQAIVLVTSRDPVPDENNAN